MSIEFEIPRYSLVREIGSGGMAVVYLATQEGLNRLVAVKVLRQSLSGSGEEFKKRFMHEGRMLAQLEHENIVKIYDIGATDDAVFMAMEFLKGGTLTQRIQLCQMVAGDVIKITAQVAMALHAAHRQNIIHRDLKPSNIMFRDPFTPVLVDFGIARNIDKDLNLTQTGMMIGTPQYMSPEQLAGKDVSATSDVYSLGLMFYRLLTGELPFTATEPIALAIQQINDPPPPLPEKFSELQPVMDLMLAKQPADRYQSTLDFCNHLRSISLTGDEYALELTAATRVFDSGHFSAPGIRISSESEKPSSRETSLVSSAVSSIITAITTRKKLRNWVLVSLLVMIAGVFFVSQYDFSGISEADKRRVTYELKRFRAYLDTFLIYGPEGGNATESLQKMIAIAPQYGEVRDAADELAVFYTEDAFDRYMTSDLDEARSLLEQALEFAPENKLALELKADVLTKIEAEKALKEIERLMTVANRAKGQGNLLPPTPGNSYEAFKEILAIDDQNEDARTGLSEIQKRVVEQARETWIAGDIQAARADLRNAEQLFGTSTHISSLMEEIAVAEQYARETQELIALLERAGSQYDEGKLVAPASDNAMESYRRILILRPGEQTAIRGLQNIADTFLGQARALFQQGQFEASLEAVNRGLQAVPTHRGLLNAQSDATKQLDTRSREIQQDLQYAQRLVATGQFVPGGPGFTENALSVFKRVEEIDPGNAQAKSGLASLPDQINEAADNFQRQDELDKAKALLVAAQKYYPDEQRYIARVASLDALIDERAVRLKLQGILKSVERLINRRPLNIEQIDLTAKALREISAEFPNEISVSDLLSNFITSINGEADLISRTGDDQVAIALIEHALNIYPANPRLKQTLDTVQQRRVDRERRELERIAAMSGQLAIDAMPWGRVMEIRDWNQGVVSLPSDTQTPFILTLPEGAYSVWVAGGDSNTIETLTIKVKRQNVVSSRVEFEPMAAQIYFERSGW